MRVLLRKLLLLLLRDPVMYTMRLSLFAVVSSFFSALYIDSRSRTQEQVRSPPGSSALSTQRSVTTIDGC